MAHTARHVRGSIRLARADTARALEDLSKALELGRAAELAADAAALLAQAPPSPAKAEALSNLVAFLALDGKAEEAIAAGAASLVMAGGLGLDEVKAHGLTFTGLARVTIGDNRLGIADLERSIQISRRLNSPEVVRGCANLASALANLGDLRGAWDFYAQGRRAAEQFGDTRGLRWLVSERHYEHYWRGEWNDALALAESVLAEPASDVEHHMAHTARHVRGSIRLARADTARALEDLSKALELGRAATSSSTDGVRAAPCLSTSGSPISSSLCTSSDGPQSSSRSRRARGPRPGGSMPPGSSWRENRLRPPMCTPKSGRYRRRRLRVSGPLRR